MKTILFAILFFAAMLYAQTDESKLGNELTLTEKTKISDIISDPESYIDQVVLVEGEVLEVCPQMGCWMELKSDSQNEDAVEVEKIKVKVKDGDIIFPMEAVGHNALVEGKVYKIELTQEEAVGYYEHIAEESGKDFDPASVTGPVTLYQIKGLGAEIHPKDG
ncbi:MAG: DUF4920 domain-containing protein [Ignavibacteria bacterium]|nr:DUF4920 domain-containing protein [Ignavibacteria bacterium]MBT8381034.1 DUF4920 domain-containing protein [Ignavibacteria bacterium]MBT8393037.1 DUF4920 domain-containing protein [Ignavibacteria bacterium]NNJ52016.1 DUF4920 domain-containing protein [Ignavibacteriaceae bacterium]NNL20500.1 DUF4920 domain-containing protein [Ignavibacteriaceae bacterium]